MVASPKPRIELPESSAAIALVKPLISMGTPVQLAWSNFELVNFLPCRAGTGDGFVAKLTTTNQRIITGVTNPTSGYSRVVSCSYSIPAGGGNIWSYTERTGQDLWLKGIDLWFTLQPGGELTAISFNIFTGFNEPSAFADMQTWRNLLPNYSRGQLSPWLVDSENQHYHWSMMIRLTGIGRRFGFTLIGSNTKPGYVAASFEISEG